MNVIFGSLLIHSDVYVLRGHTVFTKSCETPSYSLSTSVTSILLLEHFHEPLRVSMLLVARGQKQKNKEAKDSERVHSPSCISFDSCETEGFAVHLQSLGNCSDVVIQPLFIRAILTASSLHPLFYLILIRIGTCQIGVASPQLYVRGEGTRPREVVNLASIVQFERASRSLSDYTSVEHCVY